MADNPIRLTAEEIGRLLAFVGSPEDHPAMDMDTHLQLYSTTQETLALAIMTPLDGDLVVKDGKPFDIVKVYHALLAEDPDLSMPIAAIEALIRLLNETQASTIYETLDIVQSQSAILKSSVPNSFSLTAGTDLFQRYLLNSLKPTSTDSFEQTRQHLLNNGRVFADRAKAAREKIAAIGHNFVRDGKVVLTHGGSRVVGALLTKALEPNGAGGVKRFKVIYVMSEGRDAESRAIVAALRAKGVPVAEIDEGEVAYAMDMCHMVFVGAEGVAENGGIISRMGTWQIAIMAAAKKKPFYVATETHKFVRLYPLMQNDLGMKQDVVVFKSEEDVEKLETISEEKTGYFGPPKVPRAEKTTFVDYTPPELITALVTELGVQTPSAVSESLITMWY